MECLICKRTRKKSFLINLAYGAGESTIKDDIIEFVGESVREYLHDDQTVCSICLNMLEEIVASKHEVLMAIKHGEKKYTPKLGNLWTIFLRKFSEDNFGDVTPNITQNIVTGTPPLSTIPRDSTPVMYLSKTKPYNPSQEKYFELRENLKREAQDSDLRSEWSCKTEGRPYNRKDRKAFRSKLAKIQRMRKELEGTEREPVSPQRPLSSTSSLFGNDDFDDKFMKGPKRKRRQKQEVEEPREKLDLRCWNRLCEPFGDNLAFYTCHRIEKHREEAYFTCSFCEMKFFTRKHLGIHSKKHQISVLCGVCGTMQRSADNYQKHVEKHFQLSYDCFLCQLSFLTKKECNSHIFHSHRYRRLFLDRRNQTEKKVYGIVDQKTYENKSQTSTEPVEDATTANKTYTQIIMDNICNRKEESFKPMSFKEMYLAHKLGNSEPTTETLTSPSPQPTISLGDDLACKGSGAYTFQLELGLEPNADTSISNYNKLVRFPSTNRISDRVAEHWGEIESGRSTVMSGRCTPYSTYSYDRSNIPSDDEASRSDLSAWSGFHSSRRDLESRTSDLCSEVAHYLDRQSPSQSTSKGASPVCEEEQSDIETEYHPPY